MTDEEHDELQIIEFNKNLKQLTSEPELTEYSESDPLLDRLYLDVTCATKHHS